MPVSGFPTILESILISLFQESQQASIKLAGNQQRTTLVLRFDAMADTSVSTSHLSTPAEVRRNSHEEEPEESVEAEDLSMNEENNIATSDSDIITKEVEDAINKLKNGRASGGDGGTSRVRVLVRLNKATPGLALAVTSAGVLLIKPILVVLLIRQSSTCFAGGGVCCRNNSPRPVMRLQLRISVESQLGWANGKLAVDVLRCRELLGRDDSP
ncbi:hypothetical protein ElyMa_001784000 [Elysia marginata]|uniref:Uncharacterized protein n=1 Tax=Elysia marginata TaxID=1093978 RepID=A0AAV4EEE4_9GAST|nr:hypothetical protein ElyMa_001784000 [Elysia marginata]